VVFKTSKIQKLKRRKRLYFLKKGITRDFQERFMVYTPGKKSFTFTHTALNFKNKLFNKGSSEFLFRPEFLDLFTRRKRKAINKKWKHL